MTATLPDLCRAAVKLLGAHTLARAAALRCAEAGAGARAAADAVAELEGGVSLALRDVADVTDLPIWYWRHVLAEAGVVDATTWEQELLALAAEAGDREEVSRG